MSTSNNYDAIESLIFQEKLRISNLVIRKESDIMLVVLNTSATLRMRVSDYPKLNQLTTGQLNNYVLIGEGLGIHWPDADEDLSLKGFLQETLRKLIRNAEFPTAA